MTDSKHGIKLGSTLFAFTNEWHARDYTLAQLVTRIAEMKLGPGLEVIGFQSFRGFPAISDDDAARFRDLIAATGMELSCLGVNADVAIKRGQFMSAEQAADYYAPQIEAAAKLGFPAVRLQFAAPVEAVLRLLPLAEKHGIKMGPEIHAPLTPTSPPVVAYREAYAKVNSPLLGFVPDMGCCARTLPPSYLDNLRAQGLPEELLQVAVEIWHLPQDAGWKRQEFMRRVTPLRPDLTQVSALAVMFNIVSPGQAEQWRDLVPQTIHIHGKFYDFDTAGSESAIPYEEIIPVFRDGGYRGYISSEWEGHLYSRVDAFDMVARHQSLLRSILTSPPAQ